MPTLKKNKKKNKYQKLFISKSGKIYNKNVMLQVENVEHLQCRV